MTAAALHYRKTINGVGYRFALPLLEQPPPSAHSVTVTVTVAIYPKDAANLLRAPPSSSDEAVPYPFAINEELTLDVFAAGACWLLPLPDPIDTSRQRVYKVKAQRVPCPSNTPEALASPPSSSRAVVPPPSSGALALPPSLNAPAPAPSSSPVASRSSTSSAAPASSKEAVAPPPSPSAVAALLAVSVPRPQYTGEQLSLVDADSKGIAYSYYDNVPDWQVSYEEARINAYAATASASVKERNSIPFESACANDTTVDCTDKQPRSGLFNEVELSLNGAYAHRINQTRYVDVLPRGDPPPPEAKDLSRGRLGSQRWSVSKEFRTWYRFARIPKDTRKVDWYLLTGSGIPCTVRGKFIEVQGLGCPERSLEVTTTALSDGEARYKLVPISISEYACQPTAASAEASHILSLYHIVIEQNGQEHRAFEPAGQCLDFEWERHLRILGQYSSAESARSLIYSVDCHLDGTAEYVNGFGVRLRDGGSRLPLRPKAGEQGVAQIELPGELSLYNEWGAYIAPPSSLRACYSKINIDVRLPLGDGPNDLVLKVEDQDKGDYRSMQYALRPRGCFDPVRRDEWQPLDLNIINLSARRYMINVARSTVGRGLLESSALASG